MSCPPNLYGRTFGQPIFLCQTTTGGALYFLWFYKMIFELKNICVDSVHDLIPRIISMVPIPVPKYWWLSANNTAVPQVVIKGDITTLWYIDKVQYCKISNALAMEISKCKRFIKSLPWWYCRKKLGYSLHWHSFASCDLMQIYFWLFYISIIPVLFHVTSIYSLDWCDRQWLIHGTQKNS